MKKVNFLVIFWEDYLFDRLELLLAVGCQFKDILEGIDPQRVSLSVWRPDQRQLSIDGDAVDLLDLSLRCREDGQLALGFLLRSEGNTMFDCILEVVKRVKIAFVGSYQKQAFIADG